MELEIIKSEKDYVEIAFKGEEYGLASVLKELLLEEDKVEFAGYRMDHPLVASPVLMVRVSEGSPIAAIKSAARKLRKQAADFRDALKEAKRPKK